MEMSVVETVEQIGVEQRLVQAETDIKALAECMGQLVEGIRKLKAVQDETLAVLRQQLGGRTPSSH